MKFSKYMKLNEKKNEEEMVLKATEIDNPLELDYFEDETNNKMAMDNIKLINKAIDIQKKEIEKWKKRRDSDDNVEAAESILADLGILLQKWEEAILPPPEPEEEPEDGETEKDSEAEDDKEPEKKEPEDKENEGILNEI